MLGIPLAGALVTVGAWLACGGSAVAVDRIAGLRPGEVQRRVLAPLRWPLALLGAWWLLSGGGVRVSVLGATGLVCAWVLRRLVGAWRRRRAQRDRRRMVIEFCDALAAELAGGLDSAAALRRACDPWPELRAVATAAYLGGDVPSALRSAAAAPGSGGLVGLAAAWEVAHEAGSTLAVVLDRLAEGLRSDADARAEVESALGPPRATARMLAVLPLFGVFLGSSMGAHPVAFLLDTELGLGCLGIGLLLAVCGVAWVERLARSVEE